MNLLLVILRKIWVSRSRCFTIGNRHFQTLYHFRENNLEKLTTIYIYKYICRISEIYQRYQIRFVCIPDEARLRNRTTLCNTKTFHPDECNARQIELTEKAQRGPSASIVPRHRFNRISGNEGRRAFRLSGSRVVPGPCIAPWLHYYAAHAAKSSIDEKKDDQGLVRFFSNRDQL